MTDPRQPEPAFSPSDLGALDGAPGPLRVAGRVVSTGEELGLADAFATVSLDLAPPATLEAGDLAVVSARLLDGRLVVASVLERYSPRRPPAFAPDEAEVAASETDRLSIRAVGAALRSRAAMFAAVRGFFGARGFIEVDTPSLCPSPGLDLHLDAFEVSRVDRDREPERFLVTSPEYQMKRLLAGGVPRCFQVARAFRRGEKGRHHNPEFLLLEWYRAFSAVDAVMRDTEDLVRSTVRELSGSTVIERAGRRIDLAEPFERLAVADAFARYADVDASAALDLARDDEDEFFRTLVDTVEPGLALEPRGVFLVDYPASQASLARVRPDDPRVCERFELYVAGLELCNGFGELTCPEEQRRRLARDQAERERLGKPVYPLDERFLAALEEGMPPSAGNALGLDRLLALALGAQSIGDVQSFPEGWL